MSQFRISDVLRRSLSMWGRNVVPFTLLTAVAYAPLIAYTVVTTQRAFTAEAYREWAYSVIAGDFLLGPIATAMLVYAVVRGLHGRFGARGPISGVVAGVRPISGVVAGVRPIVAVIGAGIAAGGLVTLASTLLSMRLWPVVTVPLAVFGLLLYLTFYVAVPVIVAERAGLGRALERSSLLTAGYRVPIFAVLVVLYITRNLVIRGAQAAFAGDAPTPDDAVVTMAVVLAASIVFSALTAVVAVVIYHDLRVLEDGVVE